MALYQDRSSVREGEHPAFGVAFRPGGRAPVSGIYRCTRCEVEVARNAGWRLPSRRHHAHLEDWGWLLLVCVESDGGAGLPVEGEEDRLYRPRILVSNGAL